MKKTLITLLAFCGVAAADTLTISNANNTATTNGDWFSTLSATAANVSLSTEPGVTNTYTLKDYTKSFYSVSTNVGSGGSYDYVLTFTLIQDIILQSISADIFFHNSGGGAQGKDRTVKYGISLSKSESVTSLFSITDKTESSSQGAVNSNGTVVYFDAAYDSKGAIVQTTNINEGPRYAQIEEDVTNELTLEAGNTYNLKINIANGDTVGGTFVGIGNITMNGQVVPEPTTATLSLLALCGLAARRRRATR